MKRKRSLRFVFLILFFISQLFSGVHPSFAQSVISDNISFTQLSQKEIILQGPLDIQSFNFNLPADWQLLEGGILHLNFNASFNNQNSENLNPSGAAGASGYIEVTLNNIPIVTVVLDHQGENSIDLPIPLSAWVTADPIQSTNFLQFYLKTAEPCRPINGNATNSALLGLNVIVRPSSYFSLPHSPGSVVTDLRRLPYPVFQNTFIPDNAILVVPDQPTKEELQAAFITSAAFGRLSDGKLKLKTTTVGHLDPVRLTDSHIIYVGKVSSFPQLVLDKWTLPLRGDGFVDSQIGKDDGVLQMIVSPSNPALVWLLVSGQTDLGVVKSSQALGSVGNIRVGLNSSLAIVTNTELQNPQETNITDYTFESLGYGAETRSGPGIQYFDYFFQIPAGRQVDQDAYLDLVFAHSALFDFEESGLSVSLNDQYIGSFRFSDRTTQVSSWRLNLPGSAFRQGNNYLLLEASLNPITYCAPNEELWFNTRPESTLHIPTSEMIEQTSSITLDKYPSPFLPTFDKTAFVLSKDQPDSWGVAAEIAYDLGIKTGGTFINPAVAFADLVPDDIKNEYSLIIIGRPSNMPIMQELKPWLLASFDNGSDVANEPPTGFSFQVSKDVPVGYLQLFPSPWYTQGAVMALSANGAEGLMWDAEALVMQSKRSQLKGNLAVLYNNQIIASQIEITPAIEVTPIAITPEGESQSASSSGLNLVAIGAIVVFLLVVLGILVFRFNRSSKVE